MTNDKLVALLAERVMGWRIAPDRFLTGNRRWMPRWRFRPTERLEDAFRLLGQMAPHEYSIRTEKNGGFRVKIRLAESTGEASEVSKPRAITFAAARALGIEVDISE